MEITKLSIDEWIKKMCYIYISPILFSHEKERNPTIRDNMDELREPYTKWKKSDREK